jgi:hypothetical protein
MKAKTETTFLQPRNNFLRTKFYYNVITAYI